MYNKCCPLTMESFRFFSAGPSTDSTLEGRVTTTESDVDALETRATDIEADVTSLQGSVSTHTSDIANLQTDVATKSEVSLSGTTLTIDTVQNTLADPSTVSSNTTAITNLERASDPSSSSVLSNLSYDPDITFTSPFPHTGYDTICFNSTGDILAIGIANYTSQSIVQVYELGVTSWVQKGANIVDAAFPNTFKDISLSADGLTLLTSDPSNLGVSKVYNFTNGAWTQIGGDITGTVANDNLGFKLAISGNGKVVILKNASGNRCVVYKLEQNSWVKQGNDITLSGTTQDTYVDINFNGTVVAVRSVSTVKIFTYTDDWTQLGDDIAGDGERVVLNGAGNIVAVGNNYQNNAKVYYYDSEWKQLGNTVEGTNDFGYGISLSADGLSLLVGAPNFNFSSGGYAEVYQYNLGNWRGVSGPMAILTYYVGYSVSLSADGRKVAIGALGLTLTYHAKEYDVKHLQTLVGAPFDTNLGAFSGSTITPNQTVRVALQDLETEVESKSTVLAGAIGGTTLNSITIDATPYQLGGGVVANPQAAATSDLTKLTVGGTTYNVSTGTRNYQYVVQDQPKTTSLTNVNTYYEVVGFNGNDTLTITTMQADSKILIRYNIMGDTDFSLPNDYYFKLVRRVNGGSPTDLKPPTAGNRPPTLAMVEVATYADTDNTLNKWSINYIDDLNGINAGSVITYVPEIFTHSSSALQNFYVNRAENDGDDAWRERGYSLAEAEEILTGPPLTTNNVAVSGTPVHNDVLTYQSGQWTNTAMHTRNYQYKLIDDMVTTTGISGLTWKDVNGFTGSNALSITTLTSNSKIRVHFSIRGEFSMTSVHNAYFRLSRSINGGAPVTLNASGTSYPSLTTTMISYFNDANTTMDSYEIYFVDELTASDGSSVVYVPQVLVDTSAAVNFQLNRVYSTQSSENTISFCEAEEILTGPPLTVNDVAISSTPSTGDTLVYTSSGWAAQRAASQFGLPAGNNAKFWVVAGESVSRVGNYPIEHVGTGRTFNYDGDGHLYLNHATGANYLRITDSNTLMDVSTASYTFAVVVDLDLQDGGSNGLHYSKTHILTYNATNSHELLFLNNNHGSKGSLGIDYWYPNPQPFMHNPVSPPAGHPTLPTNYYEGKALIVVTYQFISSTSQTVTIYKNGTQTFTNTSGDIASNSGTNTEWLIAGSSSSTHGGFQTSKFYAAVVYDRVLTTDEINQLSIDKLVSKRQTLPFYQISDNTPVDGQNLVYSSSTGQYEPQSVNLEDINDVSIPSTPTAGEVIQWNGSAYVTAFPALPYIRMQKSTQLSLGTGLQNFNFDTHTQSSHNIFSISNNSVSVPPGTYLVSMTMSTTHAISTYISLIARKSNGYAIFDTGPGTSGTRSFGSITNIGSFTETDTINFYVFNGQNILLEASTSTFERNFASIIKIG